MDEIARIARLTRQHPEVVVELLDPEGMVGAVIFDGMNHPEYLSGGPVAPSTPLVRGSVYPKEPYIRHQHQDYEPIASDVPLADLPEAISGP